MIYYFLTILASIFTITFIYYLVLKIYLGKFLFLENISHMAFEETLKKFESVVTDKGWKIPAVHDLKLTMEKNGKPGLSNIKVFEICNPELAFRILSEDKARFASSMLPCRVSIYEKADGFVYISRMRTSMLAGFMSRLIAPAMFKASQDVEEIITVCLKQ